MKKTAAKDRRARLELLGLSLAQAFEVFGVVGWAAWPHWNHREQLGRAERLVLLVTDRNLSLSHLRHLAVTAWVSASLASFRGVWGGCCGDENKVDGTSNSSLPTFLSFHMRINWR